MPGSGSVTGQGQNLRLIAIQNPARCRGGVHEEARLVAIVVGDRVIPVQVIGGEPQKNPHVRPEVDDVGQLERTHFQHDTSGVGVLNRQHRCSRREAPADIAAQRHIHAGALEQVRDQYRGRGFPIGPGNRDQCAFEEPNGELRFSDPRSTTGSEISKNGSCGRDTGGRDNDVGCGDAVDIVGSELDDGTKLSEVGCTSCS